MTRKPIAVFDIDGTIFRSSLLIEILNTLIQEGIFPKQAAQEYEPSLAAWHNRTAQDSYQKYLDKIVEIFVKNLSGVSKQQLDAVAESLIKQMAGHTYVFTRELLKKLQKTHFLVAISGSPDEVVMRFAKAYKFDAYYATEYELIDGVYTGKRLTGRFDNKHITVEEAVREHNLKLDDSIGVGDSLGDVGFLELVSQPIAFNPDEMLYKHSRRKGWQIVIERKNVTYQLEKQHDGYRLA